MALNNKRWSGSLSVIALVTLESAIASTANPSFAQIIPDNTLGTEGSIVTPNLQIRGLPGDLIEGGAFRGSALFHSFAEFNVNNGQRVYFANPTGIENIFSRVTGNNPSDILGTLGVNGAANLYFLNPNGIIFGNNARLDVAGSFIATAANSFLFENGIKFSATNPQAPPLLALNVTPGLQYGAVSSGTTISNTGNLNVGKDLTLVADNLNLQGQLQAGRNLRLKAGDTVQIRDSITNPFIAAAGSQLLIEGNNNIDIFALNHPNSGLLSNGDMILRSGNTVKGDAHYSSGGSFRIEQLNGNLGNLSSPNDPVIRATGDVFLGGYQGASLHIFAGGSVTIPGGVSIGIPDPINGIVDNVTLSDGTIVQINGNITPTLDIRAGTTAVGIPELTGPFPPNILLPPIPNPIGTPTSADITIGGIINPGGMVFLTNQYQPNPSLPGGTITVNQSPLVPGIAIATINPLGDGGNIIIDSRGAIALNGTVNSSSFSQLSPLPPGNGGNITLIANGDMTTADIYSLGGLGGKINFTSNGTISFDNRLIFTGSISPIPGFSGGDINVKTRNLSLNNGARLLVATLGAANGGNLNVTASEAITEEGTDNGLINDLAALGIPQITALLSSLSPTALEATQRIQASGLLAITVGTGDGGNLNIDTQRLSLQGGSEASAYSYSQGNGGNVTVKAPESVSLIGTTPGNSIGGLFAITYAGGNGGNLSIDTGRLIARDGSSASAANFGTGNGGDVTVNASESVEIDGIAPSGQFISNVSAVTAGIMGDAGNLTLNTRRLTIRNGGGIGTTTFGIGKGGNLTINASESVEVSGANAISINSSGIVTDTFGQMPGAGNAGTLNINTRRLVAKDGGYISASTFGTGAGGSLFINASESVELSGFSIRAFPSGLYAQGFGAGNAGDLQVTTGELKVSDRAKITVATGDVTSDLNIPSGLIVAGLIPITFAERATGNAGTMKITANSIQLNNQASLIAKTVSGEGGNITLVARDLILLYRDSVISAEAFSGKGNGGNIIIDPPFVIGLGNSDIVADAFGGNGGNINITADSIIGLKFRPLRTPLNDITASSQFGLQGTVVINTPEVDPSRGLIILPDEFVDVQRLVDPTCKADVADNQSQFVVTGRGGLPPKPNETLRGEGVLADWVSLESELGDRESKNNTAISVNNSAPKPIVEAQGWVIDSEGKVVLVAQANHLTPQNPKSTASSCRN
ncbi:two-partner secretion domain-containing protein [Limnofasciculus baicalensis]|uniref:Filamentous hemagglutinin N-terminal domain-containing protein n=1 Tax=Limnofasciculus baicalensis BBK-W-15 TaxID=2699891 RepID=A0AAE3KL21_9CYAN|nr:filamentous hemagglutinin N-terminal domain-containing protein [Limnofasciculus baicalensis]MCP2728085.1 filamentous hemagglutinin N-terminal domain-containing protein [Limnofasciculus baicalensis BBK-W-15]